jgi:ActR/RegA family two-component response regulator
MAYKILLVDDEVNLIDPMAYSLKENGFEVCTAYNGVEALRKRGTRYYSFRLEHARSSWNRCFKEDQKFSKFHTSNYGYW